MAMSSQRNEISNDMEKVYEALSREGYNTVDNLVQWLKDAKVLEVTKNTEEDVYRMFSFVKDTAQVTHDQFSLTQKERKIADDVCTMLCNDVTRFQKALGEATSCFKDTLKREAEEQEKLRIEKNKEEQLKVWEGNIREEGIQTEGDSDVGRRWRKADRKRLRKIIKFWKK